MFELFGTTYYFSGQGSMLYVLAYLPAIVFVVWLLQKIVRRYLVRRIPRFSVVVSTTFVLLGLPFIDVYQIGQHATKLCKAEGDMRIYKTVEADGFFGTPSIEYWSKHGFAYVEYTHSVMQGKRFVDQIRRAFMRDGQRQSEVVDEVTSRYGVGGGHSRDIDAYETSPYVRWRIESVTDRITGEILGDFAYFQILPGRFDRFAINTIGLTFRPWICGAEKPVAPEGVSPQGLRGRYSYIHIIKATIRPARN